MARPKKNPAEKRDQRFNLRYTMSELEAMRLEADRAGLHPHEYARRRSLGHRVAAPGTQPADPALINELNRIGVNLNQLAKSTHLGKNVEGEIDGAVCELRRILTVMLAQNVAQDT